MSDEKVVQAGPYAQEVDVEDSAGPAAIPAEEDVEIFKVDAEVKYRTVGWPKAAAIFLKSEFALGVLSIPSCLDALGAVGGSILIVCWGALLTYGAVIMGDFRLKHKNIHNVCDACDLIAGPIIREIAGVAYIIAFILSAGVSMLGISIAFNALTEHAICTVWFTFVAMLLSLFFGSFPKFGQIGVLTWFGLVSIIVAVLMVVIAVTTLDRPANAPAGVYDLGFHAIAYPGFVTGLTSCNAILVSYSATPAFMTAAAEMRRPKDYNKAVYASMGFTTAAYLSFALVMYAWCGQYVATPALGSAGPLIKKISYGIALPGLIVSSCLYCHIGTKFAFVRLLKNTRHLQEKTMVHHAVWYGGSLFMSIISFVIASSIPFFTSLVSLIVVFLGPLSICLPMAMWFYDNKIFGRRPNIMLKALHGALFIVGAFVSIAGAYAVCQQIADQYAAGLVGSAFSCADNSNSAKD